MSFWCFEKVNNGVNNENDSDDFFENRLLFVNIVIEFCQSHPKIRYLRPVGSINIASLLPNNDELLENRLLFVNIVVKSVGSINIASLLSNNVFGNHNCSLT